MREVVDPRDGKRVRLFGTPELDAELAAWWAAECIHPSSELRRFVTKNGTEQVCPQCLTCGSRTGNPVKHPDRSSLPLEDETLQGAYRQRRNDDRDCIHVKHIDLERARDASFQIEYDAYIKSDTWFAKRDLVLRRCNRVCEGCGEAPATQVHHLHYRDFKQEFLFDLVGICRPCHDRLHNHV